MAEAQTYDTALSSASERVWPGCYGLGRCRPCGRIHDFSRPAYFGGPLRHSFECLENHQNGCPMPIPSAEHQIPKGKQKCSVCGKTRVAVRWKEERIATKMARYAEPRHA